MAFQPVEVAVTVMARDAKLLAVYNHKWGAFSLPMTKRKKWQDPKIPVGVCEEEWIVAAARAAAEILGKPLSAKQLPQKYRSDPGISAKWRRWDLEGLFASGICTACSRSGQARPRPFV